MTPKPPDKIVRRLVRHPFTIEERNTMGSDLARAHGALRGIQGELDQVKASYKAKITESEAQIDKLSTDLVNGFDMRTKECRVVFDPKRRKKLFFVVHPEGELFSTDEEPVAEEDMTPDDFQEELLAAEAAFERREELPLFQPAGDASGVMVVGRLGGRWFTALRIKFGRRQLDERLDSEQKSVKKRPDAVKLAAKRANEWLAETFGAEEAKGFADSIAALVEANKEREE